MFTKKRLSLLLAALMALLIVAGCTASETEPEAAEPTPEEETLVSDALVESFSFNPETGVITVEGNFRNGCEELGEVSHVIRGTTIDVTVLVTEETGQACTEALVPFTTEVQVDTTALEPGVYTLNVNDMTDTITVEDGAEFITGEALVESVEVLNDSATELELLVTGNLPDGCTELADAEMAVEGDTILINITTVRPADQMCTEALVPFEQTYTFDVSDVSPGEYTVDVNGVTAPVVIRESTTSGDFTMGEALVDSVEIAVLESFPVQIRATVRGNLPDGCTQLAGTEQRIEGNTIYLDVLTRRPDDEVCTQALVPFEETYDVDVLGLPAGTYTLNANGVTADFTLDVNNEAAVDPFEQCEFADESQPSFVNTTDGYCIQHPIGFQVETPIPGILIISDMDEDDPRATLTIEREGPAEGLTLLEIANARLDEYSDSEVTITETEIAIDGETARVADGVPGNTPVRQAYVIHDGTVYILTLAPVDQENYPDATDRAEALWETAITTLDWIPN